MGHSRVRAKVRRRKVAALAAYSRQFTVHNTKKGISPKVDHPLHYGDLENAITCPFTGHKFVPTNPHPIPGKFGITITGYDWVPIDEYKANTGLLWEHKKYPQPKRLIKCKKRIGKGGRSIRAKRNDFATYTRAICINDRTYIESFPNFPYTLPKMNKVQYMEKLVEHKLAKWERKNVCPEAMFTEDVEKWKHERETMKERFRDFVVSIYDKLHLTGRFVVAKDKYTEEKVAEIKDVDGEGHKINDLPKTSKLIKKAQKITNETKVKRPNLVATNLKDHKKQKGRIILPQAA